MWMLTLAMSAVPCIPEISSGFKSSCAVYRIATGQCSGGNSGPGILLRLLLLTGLPGGNDERRKGCERLRLLHEWVLVPVSIICSNKGVESLQ